MALDTLEAAGLAQVPDRLGALPLNRFQIATGGRMATLPLPRGAVVSRAALDAALIQEAVDAEVSFLGGTTARLEHSASQVRCMTLSKQLRRNVVEAAVVVAADGLAGRLLADSGGFSVRRARHSRVGGAAILAVAPSGYARQTIYMACGRAGYVGLVRLETGQLNIAAAVDPEAIREDRGFGALVARVLAESGLPAIEGLAQQRWQGTAALTRTRTPLAAERVFVIGDAAGYVEPFTGEGMAIAMSSGMAVAPLVRQALACWNADLARRWDERYRGLFRRRHLSCRVVTSCLRSPWLMRIVIAGLERTPLLAASYVRRLNGAPS
jgi:flavin-dependent dehydrogenase